MNVPTLCNQIHCDTVANTFGQREYGQNSCFKSPDNMKTRGCCISVLIKGISETTRPSRPAKPLWPRISYKATLH